MGDIQKSEKPITFGQNLMVTFDLEDVQTKYRMRKLKADSPFLILDPGKRSIPLIKKMFNKDHISVSFKEAAHPEGEIKLDFIITGLAEEIKPIRKVCHW